MNRAKKFISGALGFLLVLGIWEGVFLSGRYETSLLPSPYSVLNGLLDLISNGTLFTDIKVSLFRFAVGYLSAVTLAVILGLIFGWYGKAWSLFEPLVQVLRPISPIAWFPFIVLWFGIGDTPAIVIIFIASFYPVLLSTVSAVSKIDPIYLKVARNFGISQFSTIKEIVLPSAFPYIAVGLHIALGSAWVFLVAGEMVGAQSGLGYLIIDSRNNMRTDLVLAGIISIGIIGLILDKLIKLLEKWIGKNWGIVPNERGA